VEKPGILFFLEDIQYTLRHRKKIRRWLHNAIQSEEKIVGRINVILCSDEYLYNLNLTFLKHDTLTDIITFDYSEKDIRLSGDVFISLERVKENSKLFRVPLVHELYRVMIHGILHLAGYRDKKPADKELMRSKEDYYLSLLPDFLG
jgi:rRNA maturation RNase YbeY